MEHPCFPISFSTQTCPTFFRNFLICLLVSTLPAPIISPHSPTMDGLLSALLILQWPLTVLRRKMSPHPGLRCSWSLLLLSLHPGHFPSSLLWSQKALGQQLRLINASLNLPRTPLTPLSSHPLEAEKLQSSRRVFAECWSTASTAQL